MCLRRVQRLRADCGPPSSSGSRVAHIRRVAERFDEVMDQELGVRTQIGAISLRQAPRSSDEMVIAEFSWTAGWTPDGGHLQSLLQQKSARIERILEEDIHRDGSDWAWHVAVWAKATFTYYGPHAHKLPHGPKISQNLGQRFGRASENGSPAYVG